MKVTSAVLLSIISMLPAIGAAQAPAASAPAAPAGAGTPSSLLQPALGSLQTTVASLRTDKWKSGTVRTEAAANINSIQKDIVETLPPLLSAADSAPDANSKMLPVSRNIDALYAVLLRVWDGARTAGSPDQVAQLQQAMTSLESARHALINRMEDVAEAQEKQIGTLQSTLKAQAAAVAAMPAPVAQPCTPPPPAKKVVKKKPKPAAAATPTPAAAPKPQ